MAAVTGLEGNTQFQWYQESEFSVHPGASITPNYLLVTGARLSVDNGYEYIYGLGSMDFEAATESAKLYKLTLEFWVQTLDILQYVLGTSFTPADSLGSLAIESKLDLATDEYIHHLGCTIDSAQLALEAGVPGLTKGTLNIVPRKLVEASATGFQADATRVKDVPILFKECDLKINDVLVNNIQSVIINIKRNLQLDHVIKATEGDLIVQPACGHREYEIAYTELYKDKTHFTRLINATKLTNFITVFPLAKVGADADIWTFSNVSYEPSELPFGSGGNVMKPNYPMKAESLAIT